MSGQWEVVKKNKKDKQIGKTKKMSKVDKQKFVDSAPKVEDFLPVAQVKTLYTTLDINNESSKPTEKAVKPKEQDKKKPNKKIKEKKETMNKENKPPKTIEAAVALITAKEVQNLLKMSEAFETPPFLVLKGLATWLNPKLPADHVDHNFTPKSWDHPLCLLSSDTRAALKKGVQDKSPIVIQMFFDYMLVAMANDMSKGAPVTGYKMLLQLVASQFPSVATRDLTKAAGVRHSYQNRPAIGCSIMWALGQAGFKDLSSGLQVWQKVMLPVAQLRHYSQFISDYLKCLVARSSTSKGLSFHQYLELLDSVPTDYIAPHLDKLQAIVNNALTADQLHKNFEALLHRLNPASRAEIKRELIQLLLRCLREDPQSFTCWRRIYMDHLTQSAILLNQLNSEWKEVNVQQLKETLKTFRVTNDDLRKHSSHSEGLQNCSTLCNEILRKMSATRSFSWRLWLLTLSVALGAVLWYDISSGGSLKGSKIGQILAKIGALKHCETAAVKIGNAWKVVHTWGELNLPANSTKIWGYMESARTLVGSATALQRLAEGVRQVGQFCADQQPLVGDWVSRTVSWVRDSV